MSLNSDTSAVTRHWKTRWVLYRNQILSSPGFQRWAARTPVIRSIARRKAAAQFDLVAGFVYSQILSAFVESGLMDALADRPRSAEQLAGRIGLGTAATERLLRAATAIDLVESPQSDVWTLGAAGAALVPNTGALAMIRHHGLLYHDLADPLALLSADRGEQTALSAFWSYASKSKDTGKEAASSADYSALMAATQPMVANEILAAYDFTRHRSMLDIGGGSGAFVTSVAAVAPDLRINLFDLAAVMPEATARLGAQNLQNRVTLHPGSFKHDPLPTGQDLITLVRILHDHDEPVVRALLAKIWDALPSGGTLLIVEPLAQTRGAERMGDAYFGFYLWAMGSGQPRSFQCYKNWLETAGFKKIREVKTALPIITRAIVATK